MTAASNDTAARQDWQPDRSAELRALMASRILILDGAMGTMVQRHGLVEADYRGARFAAHGKDLKGNNDLLNHHAAGRDRRHPRRVPRGGRRHHRDQHLQRHPHRPRPSTASKTWVYELNVAGAAPGPREADAAQHARQAALRGRRAGTDLAHGLAVARRQRPRASATSPSTSWWWTTTSRSRGLVAGGVDMLLVETVFDTLNAKAALFAIEKFFERSRPALAADDLGTITDASGRTCRARPPRRFWNSLRHAKPLAFGLNCALGAKELRQHVEESFEQDLRLLRISAHPNAGLPNAFGGYDETPPTLADEIHDLG
jgi:5-methyltetrahydrofolate--homocysteine methyltransferase